MKKRIIIALVLIIVAFVAFYWLNGSIYQEKQANKQDEGINSFADCLAAGYPILESFPEQCLTPDGRSFGRNLEPEDSQGIKDIEVLADNLDIPWELVFLPTREMLLTERSGNLINIEAGNREVIDNVRHVGEGGLLGLALHPQYEDNNYLYLYLTTDTDNRVVRYVLEGNELIFDRIIIDKIPLDRFHNGGRIAFGPDKLLYITSGDAQNTSLAQDLSSLAGKILRLDAEGNIPADNPFGSPVYSYGHRNSQGLAWDNQARLWSTEHGPTSLDELNLIEIGSNYGWPLISGDETRLDLKTSKINSGAANTWAPSGMAYWDNSIFFAGLRGEALYEARLEDDRVVELKTHFKNSFGRLRNVVLGPDNMLYLLTNNTDGRGDVGEGDDKLIRINPQLFR